MIANNEVLIVLACISHLFSIKKKKGVETKSSEYKRKGILTYDTSFKERHKRKKKYNSKQFVRHRTCLFDAAFLQQTSFEFKGIEEMKDQSELSNKEIPSLSAQ